MTSRPTLRQDIVDELGDHLVCAYKRELLRGANSQLARQRVLERFGDPAAVARRLWLDAMKGKFMAQRVLIATCLVVTLASLSLVGLVWIQSSRGAAQTSEANRKLSEALAQSQIANKEMMKTLSEMSEAIQNPRSPDWNPVKIKLTEDTIDGPPAVGCSVSFPGLRMAIQRSIGQPTTRASPISACFIPVRTPSAFPRAANYRIPDWIWTVQRRTRQQCHEADRLSHESTRACARTSPMRLACRPGKGGVGCRCIIHVHTARH